MLETCPKTEFSSEYFTEMLLSKIFRPSVVKYGILSDNRRSKLHAVIDCLFFLSFLVFHCWRRCCFRNCNRPCQRRVSEKKVLLRFSLSLLMMEVGYSNYGDFAPFPSCKGSGNEKVIKRESVLKATSASIAWWEVSLQALFFTSLSMHLLARIDQLVISTIFFSPLCTAKEHLTLFGERWLKFCLILGVRTRQTQGWRERKKTKKARDNWTITKPQLELNKQRKNITGSYTGVNPKFWPVTVTFQIMSGTEVDIPARHEKTVNLRWTLSSVAIFRRGEIVNFPTLFQTLLKRFSAIFSIENTLDSCRFEAPLQDSFKSTRHAKAGLQPNDNFIHIQASQREVDRDFQSVYSRLVLCKTFRLVYTMTQLLNGWIALSSG